MLKVAVLSAWHAHSRGYAKEINALEDGMVSCVWDENPERGREWAKELGVDFVENYDDVLKRDDVDAVMVGCPTYLHEDIITKAANAKKHIFTEKVVSFTVESANRIKKAIEDNGVQFVISYPRRSETEFIAIKKAIDEGHLGQITMTRIRNGHNGSTGGWLKDYWFIKEHTGGGAMMDLGAHPMYLSHWYLGEPKTITSTFSYTTGKETDDNAACVLTFENGAIAITESTFAAYYAPYIVELYGTDGTIYYKENKMTIKSKKTDGVAITYDTKTIKNDKKIPMEMFYDACVNGVKPEYDIDQAIMLTKLMQAAYIAGDEKRTVSFDEIKG